jgi:hypothetical protein
MDLGRQMGQAEAPIEDLSEQPRLPDDPTVSSWLAADQVVPLPDQEPET